MSPDRTPNLEAWWLGLSRAQRGALLPLERGEELPAGHVIGLSNAQGVGPHGSKWERDGYPFHVDSDLSAFLQLKRHATPSGQGSIAP
jgi:hypothetical protein